MITSRKMRGTRGTGEVHTGFLWEYLSERDHLEDLSVDGKMILKWIFEMGKYGMECSGSGYGQVAGAYECSNELPGSIKCGECFG